MPNSSCFALMYSKESVALSFITFPRLPVMVREPLPSDRILSMKRISPPTLVQARPVTTPDISAISEEFDWDIGTPKISSICSIDILGLYSFSMAICNATHLVIAAMFFSNLLTPLSRV